MLQNFLEDLPSAHKEEILETLIKTKSIRIERIVSQGQCSPKDFWYDQNEHEWVIVLQGRAKLEFQGDTKIYELGPGDFVNIKAHKKHRVEWTDSKQQTVWLAVFYL